MVWMGWCAMAAVMITSGCWRSASDMTSARAGHSATLLGDGRVLIVGGRGGTGAELASAELFDPAIDGFVATGSLLVPRRGHVAVRLVDGRALILGGEIPGGEGALKTIEAYSPSAGTFSVAGSLALARSGFAATLLADGTVLVTGGRVGYEQVDSAEIFDPVTGASTLLAAHMTVTRAGHSAVVLVGGRVLIYGGRDPRSSGGGGRTEAEIYDPLSRSFVAAAPTVSTRSVTAAVLLQDGRVLISGGDIGGAAELTPMASAEVFNPGTSTFTGTGAPLTARAYHTATLLPGGDVVIAGGLAQKGVVLNSAERWSPGTGAFTATATMSTPRVGHTATALGDGRVLVAGGTSAFGGAPLASAELYQ